MLKLDKKYRYIIHSALMATYVYVASVVFWNSSFYLRVVFGLLLLLVSTFFVHYPNVGRKNLGDFVMVLILPSYLLGSVLLALKYYPNLSIIFKIVMMLGSAVMFYIIAIVDNIFLVVNEREETIPLYRAAVPWSQILLVVVSIPLYAGIFKIPTNSFIQAFIIGILACVLNLYQFWSYRHEDNLVSVRVGGIGLFSIFVGFITFVVGIATSFLPVESFLRGLTASAGLMFGLFYTSSFLKNSINKRLLFEYIAIILGFILLSILFQ